MTKISQNLEKNNFAAIVIAVLAAVKTLWLYDYFGTGDFLIYKDTYEVMNGLGFFEGYLTYISSINSAELVHFLLTWFSSNAGIGRELFLAISNALFAYFAATTLNKNLTGRLLSFPLLLLNGYADIFYFSAERLKYALLLLAIAASAPYEKKRPLAILLAVAAHVQALLILALFHAKDVKLQEVLKRPTLKFRSAFLLIIIVIFIFLSPLIEHLIQKVSGYSDDFGGSIPVKTLGLGLVFLLLSQNKSGALLVALMAAFASFIVGDGRINFIYFILIIFECVRRDTTFARTIAIILMLYGVYQDFAFLANVVQLGTGFDESGNL